MTDFFVARLQVPPQRGAFVELAPLAQQVTAVRRFDLDHFGAELAEDAGNKGAGDQCAEFNHLQASQRLRERVVVMVCSGRGRSGPSATVPVKGKHHPVASTVLGFVKRSIGTRTAYQRFRPRSACGNAETGRHRNASRVGGGNPLAQPLGACCACCASFREAR